VSGLFVSLEGVDGAGKSTLAHHLRRRFEEQGREVVLVREPGGTALGEAIRTLLLRREEVVIDPEAQMLLFLASRVQLLETVILPALDRGAVVLSDRFHLSTIVYQGIAGSLGEERSVRVCSAVLGERRPDLHLVLDLPLELARERRGKEVDRFERSEEFLARVVEGFRSTSGLPGDRIVRIPATGAPEEVARLAGEEVDRVVA